MISEIIEKWIKGILIDGITGNLSGLFDNVNAKVGEIASDVGSTPQAWNSGIFNMLRSLSETVVLPIAAAILALVMCHELIQMITEKNNMHDFDTSMFFRWIFKSAFAILIVSNTWNIVMGVFDATQSVVNQSSGVIIGETSIHFDRLIPGLEFQLESMTIGSLLSLWFQTLVVGLTMNILSICIFLVTYGRMIEIYVVTALGPIPLATMGSSEWRSTGQNYLKSLLALGFQAFLIMIVVGIYAVLINQIKIQRSLTTSNVAVFVPFVTQELFQSGAAMYYGINAKSHNMIMLDRKQARCPNGLKLGTPGSGKSMSCKSEIVSVFLTTADDIFISDPEAEYYPLVKRLHGQVIKLSPTSKDYVNPLDINLNYSEDDSPLALKSDFVLSFCELVMGGKTGLEAIERTVIDRAVKAIYRPYLANPCPENMPILSDLHQALLDQHLPEADRVAQALDLYVSGSLNVFNHKTNVDIHNRLVSFDIKELGKQLKKLGMLIIQDQIWGRVTQNRSQGRATWYFADEFHLLLKEEQTAAYSAEIWKRFRKWGGVPTGATQNVKDLLSSPEIENILENSDFITLLNQASGDRKILSERLNLSADQQKYIDNSEPGEGLLIFENVVLPFSNPIRELFLHSH